MNNVFKDVMGDVVFGFLDDILIFLKNLAEHRMHVSHILLETLRKQCFCAKASKCTFTALVSFEYLEHMVELMTESRLKPRNGFR